MCEQNYSKIFQHLLVEISSRVSTSRAESPPLHKRTLNYQARDVHGNGKDWDPTGPMEFPWKWECDKPWDGNGMGMGIRRMGM